MVRFEPDLLPGDNTFRRLFIMSRALKFMTETLPHLQTDGFVPGAKSPLEQADDLLTDFVVSEVLSGMPPVAMTPHASGIWELRAPDLRFFGWFWCRGTCILSGGAYTRSLKTSAQNYSGYREQAVYDRDSLNLDPPAFVTGRLEDVL